MKKHFRNHFLFLVSEKINLGFTSPEELVFISGLIRLFLPELQWVELCCLWWSKSVVEKTQLFLLCFTHEWKWRSFYRLSCSTCFLSLCLFEQPAVWDGSASQWTRSELTSCSAPAGRRSVTSWRLWTSRGGVSAAATSKCRPTSGRPCGSPSPWWTDPSCSRPPTSGTWTCWWGPSTWAMCDDGRGLPAGLKAVWRGLVQRIVSQRRSPADWNQRDDDVKSLAI